MLGILAILGYVWKAVNAWSNLEFISQKSGLFWKVVHFLFATPAGANVISITFVALFVFSLLFQIERVQPKLPAGSSSALPALPAVSVTAVEQKAKRANIQGQIPEG